MKTNAPTPKYSRSIDMAVFSFLFSVAVFCVTVLFYSPNKEKVVMQNKKVFIAQPRTVAQCVPAQHHKISQVAASPKNTVKTLANATKVDMVKVQQTADPNLPFESFGVMVTDGVANIRWTDKESKPVTYMVEKSEDGTNYEIYSVTDGPGNLAEATEQTFNQSDNDPGQYYRLLKIVHGGSVYEGNARGVIKSKQADVASIRTKSAAPVLAFAQSVR